MVAAASWEQNGGNSVGKRRQEDINMPPQDDDDDVEGEEEGPRFVSQMHPHSKYLVIWSPDGKYLASASHTRLTVRDPENMQIQVYHSCVDAIEHIDWAPDSDFILCACYKRGTGQAFQLSDPTWSCKITEGVAGISWCGWSPDSRHILTITDFALSLTIWPLSDPTKTFVIKKPKAEVTPVFSPDGSLLTVASRQDGKDHISLYSTSSSGSYLPISTSTIEATTTRAPAVNRSNSISSSSKQRRRGGSLGGSSTSKGGGWRALRTFSVDTVDMCSMHWAPDGSALAIQDTNLVYGLYIYTPDGHCRLRLQPYEDALGIKSLGWSPDSRFLAVGSYDQAVRLISSVTWSVVAEWKHIHPRHLPHANRARDMVTYTKHINEDGDEGEEEFVPHLPATTLPNVKPDPTKPNPKLGVGLISWSNDGRYLLTRNDNMGPVLWIWDTEELGLKAVLVYADNVRSARWHPSSLIPQLAIATGGSRFYLWSPAADQHGGSSPHPPSWYEIPLTEGRFDITRLRWGGAAVKGEGESKEQQSNNVLILMSPDHWCACALPTALPH